MFICLINCATLARESSYMLCSRGGWLAGLRQSSLSGRLPRQRWDRCFCFRLCRCGRCCRFPFCCRFLAFCCCFLAFGLVCVERFGNCCSHQYRTVPLRKPFGHFVFALTFIGRRWLPIYTRVALFGFEQHFPGGGCRPCFRCPGRRRRRRRCRCRRVRRHDRGRLFSCTTCQFVSSRFRNTVSSTWSQACISAVSEAV